MTWSTCWSFPPRRTVSCCVSWRCSARVRFSKISYPAIAFACLRRKSLLWRWASLLLCLVFFNFTLLREWISRVACVVWIHQAFASFANFRFHIFLIFLQNRPRKTFKSCATTKPLCCAIISSTFACLTLNHAVRNKLTGHTCTHNCAHADLNKLTNTLLEHLAY